MGPSAMHGSTIFKSFLEFRICFPGADVEAIQGVHRAFKKAKGRVSWYLLITI